MNTYIAVDIGASSGRLMISRIENSKIELEEIHRFENSFTENAGFLTWDSEYLLEEILKGLVKVKDKGIENCTLGIDTWAVDYALLDDKGNKIQEVISYRDNRTEHAIDQVAEKMSLEEIYKKTGIQFQPFNTLFQLFVESKQILKQTDSILLVPDYLNFRLTGKKVLEKTNASTTQLLNVDTGDLDEDLLEMLELKREQFPEIVEPGTIIGQLDKELFPGYDLPSVEVIVVASHDTASAVLGAPGEGADWAYLSSGTWSLLGVESEKKIINKEAYTQNYTNELGAYETVRFLKNIIGMWLIQEVVREYGNKYTPRELVELASEVEPFLYHIDVNDARFLNPHSMIKEIQKYCQENIDNVPETPGEIARTIYDSLSLCYKDELETLSKLIQNDIKELIIVGGGGNISLLNQMIADITGLQVRIGPAEATALGNILVQMIAKKEVLNISEGRELLRNSYPSKIYSPNKVD